MENIFTAIFIFFFINNTVFGSNSVAFKDSINYCTIAENVDNSLHYLKRNINHEILSSQKPEFVFRLLDTLTNKFQKSNDVKYIKSLSQISNYSDGYIGEYLIDNLKTLYYNKFDQLLDYFYCNKKTDSCIKFFMIEAIKRGSDSVNLKRDAIDKINLIISKESINEKKRAFLIEFEKEI